MVAGFRRSLSFPPPTAASAPRNGAKSLHARSISLPCSRSHPIVSHLEDDILALRDDWHSRASQPVSPAWLCAGIVQLDLLLTSLDDLLHLPQTQDALRLGPASAESLLEDFLRFADAHGTFRSTLLALKQQQAEAGVAIRRTDAARLASSVRAQKKTEKELAKLASTLLEMSKTSTALRSAAHAPEAELAGIMREVTAVIASASASVFSGIAAASSSVSTEAACLSSSRSSWMVSSIRRKTSSSSQLSTPTLLEKLEGLEECIGALESRSDRVFRRLINTRVALLNSLTPSL